MAHPADSIVAGTTNPTVIWFPGDSQSLPDSMGKVFDYWIANEPTMLAVVSVGDLTMNGEASEWTTVLGELSGRLDQTWAARPIYGSCIGNHEILDAAGLTNWQTNLPGQHGASPAPHLAAEYWAATIGLVRVIAIDTTSAYSAYQCTWLKTEILQSIHWGLWPVIIGHLAPYSCCVYDSSADAPIVLPLIQVAEDAVTATGFNGLVWLNGHIHRTERTVPMKLGVPAAGGITYFNLGCSTNESNTGAAPTKTDTLDGAPNIVRTDNYDAAVILAYQRPGTLDPRRVWNRCTATPTSLTFHTWSQTIPAGALPAPVLLDTFTVTR